MNNRDHWLEWTVGVLFLAALLVVAGGFVYAGYAAAQFVISLHP